jgi:hypothetical protein
MSTRLLLLAGSLALALVACDEAPERAGRSSPPVAAVATEHLAELCAPELAGWQRTKLSTGEHPLLGASLTSALALYTRKVGDADQKLALGLIDGAHQPEAYASFDLAWATRLENASLGYSHFELGPDRGVELLSRHPPTVQLRLLVADRFLVEADAEELAPEDVHAFLAAVPLDRLRALR